MNVLSPKDQIKLIKDSYEIIISGISWKHKLEIGAHVKMREGKEIPDSGMQLLLTIKYAVKDIKGLKNLDESPFIVEKEGEYLSDDCAGVVLEAMSEIELTSPMMMTLQKKLEEVKAQGILVEFVAKKP